MVPRRAASAGPVRPSRAAAPSSAARDGPRSQAIGRAEIPNIRGAWLFALLAVIGFRYSAVKDNLPQFYKKACRDWGIDPDTGLKAEAPAKKSKKK